MPQQSNPHILKVERTPDIFYQDRPKKTAWNYAKNVFWLIDRLPIVLCYSLFHLLRTIMPFPPALAISLFIWGMVEFLLNKVLEKKQPTFTRTLTYWGVGALIIYSVMWLIFPAG